MRVIVLLLTLLIASPAAAERYVLSYEGAALGLLPLGDMSIDADVADDSYQVTATLRSRGLLDWFERTNLRASASGLIVAESVRWRRYQLDHHYSRKHRLTNLEMGEDGALIARIEPNYRLWGDPPVDDAQRRRSRDPLSTLVAMGLDVALTRRCAGAYPTFDGRFHYLLELAGGETANFRGGGYRGPVLKCALGYIAVAGFETRDAGRRRIPHGEVWFALTAGAAFAPPVRISTPLSAGGAVVRLTSWRRAEVNIEYGAP